MLETIREFALERLAELPGVATLGRRHAEHYLRFAQARRRANTRAILDELEADYDNIRTARAWFEANGEIDAELELAAALTGFADTHGHWREELAAAESALARAGGASPAARALGWQALAGAAYCAGDRPRAADAGEQALALHRSVGSDLGASAVLMLLSLLAAEEGDYDRATALEAETRELSARLGEPTHLAAATQNLGLYALIRGDTAQGKELSAESLEAFRELGDERGIISALENLGLAELFQGNLGPARELLIDSLERSQAIESRYGIFNALVALGALSAAEGNAERAAQLLGAADAVREDAGADRFEALEARLHDETTERARAELGDEAAAAAYAGGRSLSLDVLIDSLLDS